MVDVHFHTAESTYRRVTTDPRATTAPERVAIAFAGELPPARVDPVVTAFVECNAGRWIVACLWCSSAQVASDADRRFWCVTCRNAAVGGRWIRTTWPAPPVRRGVEGALRARPGPGTRNWRPGETVAELVAENIEHGLPREA